MRWKLLFEKEHRLSRNCSATIVSAMGNSQVKLANTTSLAPPSTPPPRLHPKHLQPLRDVVFVDRTAFILQLIL